MMDDSTATTTAAHLEMLTYTSVLSLQREDIPLDQIGTGACRSVSEFEKVRKLGEGTYGLVYEGRDRQSEMKVALKQVRLDLKKEGLSVSVVREIQALFSVQHENVVRLFDVAVGHKLHRIFLVMEYCEQDLASLLDNMSAPFTEPQVKCLLLQLLKGVHHLHRSHLIHRDIKVSNLLLTAEGVLKIGDFGLARVFGDPPLPMTPRVVTLWYRSPELLFCSPFQSTAIDMWACGCIFGELLIHKPLLPGRDEMDQIRRIIHLLGAPTERIWPGYSQLPALANVQLLNQPYNNLKAVFTEASPECLQLLNRLFVYDPKRRATAQECLDSDYLNTSPMPCSPAMLPSGSGQRRKSRKREAAAIGDLDI